MPRTAYLIPGRGSKWGGWRRDVRRFRRRRLRRRRRRFRLRSPGWVATGGRATHPPASQPAGWPHSPHSPHLVRKKSSIPKSQDPLEKINNFEPLIILWHLIGAITPTSILIFIAAFEFGLQKLFYIDLMQVF